MVVKPRRHANLSARARRIAIDIAVDTVANTGDGILQRAPGKTSVTRSCVDQWNNLVLRAKRSNVAIASTSSEENGLDSRVVNRVEASRFYWAPILDPALNDTSESRSVESVRRSTTFTGSLVGVALPCRNDSPFESRSCHLLLNQNFSFHVALEIGNRREAAEACLAWQRDDLTAFIKQYRHRLASSS